MDMPTARFEGERNRYVTRDRLSSDMGMEEGRALRELVRVKDITIRELHKEVRNLKLENARLRKAGGREV